MAGWLPPEVDKERVAIKTKMNQELLTVTLILSLMLKNSVMAPSCSK